MAVPVRSGITYAQCTKDAKLRSEIDGFRRSTVSSFQQNRIRPIPLFATSTNRLHLWRTFDRRVICRQNTLFMLRCFRFTRTSELTRKSECAHTSEDGYTDADSSREGKRRCKCREPESRLRLKLDGMWTVKQISSEECGNVSQELPQNCSVSCRSLHGD